MSALLFAELLTRTARFERGRQYTYAEIGEELGVSGARVQQIEAQALAKLRRNARMLKLLRETVDA